MSARVLDHYVIADTASLEQAMRCIDRSKGVAALVVHDQRLIGIVTNGDIRRAILRGSALSRPVVEIMNRNPVVLQREQMDDSGELSKVLLSLEDTGTSILPVVDSERAVVDLLIADQLEALRSKALRHPGAARKLEETRVLLVGGAGYIGSVLARLLLREGFAVRVADRLLYGRNSIEPLLGQPHYEFTHCDFRHIEQMIDLVTDVHAVVYLAEIVGDPACALDPNLALETNFLSVLAFSTLCSHLQVNRFVYLSSCSVYGASDDPGAWLDEGAPVNPVSLYAQMKIKSETALLSLAREHVNFSPTVLRLATVFGVSPRPRFDLVVNRMTAHALRDGMVTIFGGEQWRPSLHVSDVARAVLMVLQAPLEAVGSQVFNVGDNHMNFQIKELGRSVAEAIPGTRIVVQPGATDARDYRVCFNRIRSTIGFEARTTLAQGITELRDYLRAHPVDFRLPRFNNSGVLDGAPGGQPPDGTRRSMRAGTPFERVG